MIPTRIGFSGPCPECETELLHLDFDQEAAEEAWREINAQEKAARREDGGGTGETRPT